MSNLANLHRAVQATLTSKRLGQPVFVRYLWHSLDKPETVLPRLAQLADTVTAWLGQTLERVYAVGGIASGQVSLTLGYREGGSALVSWARSPTPGDGVDLMVLGNRGAIYHDAGGADLWDGPARLELSAGDARVQILIEKALRTGKPEEATP